VAVLGDRGTGVLDMLIQGLRQDGQNIAQPNMSPVPPTPLQRTMNQPQTTLGAYGQMTTSQPQLNSPIYESNMTPLMADMTRGRVLDSVDPMRQMPEPMPVQQVVEGEQARRGMATPDTMGMEKLAADAAKIKGAIDENPQLESDPSFMDQVKGYFGSRENMLRLAMAFNTMRLEPDAQLTAALSKQLEGIQKTKVNQMSQQEIVQYLNQNGYVELAKVAARNPKMASTIMEQVLQKELKPAASRKAYEPILSPETGQYSLPVYDPETDSTSLIPIEGAVGETPAEKAKRETEEAVRLSDLSEGQKAADKAFDRANLYRNDINMLYQALTAAQDPNTQTGFLSRYQPAFTTSTAALREAGNRLGLGVVSSVTFGALSASELDLALKTGLDINLPRPQLIAEIERRIAAQEKLYEEIMKDAELLASGIGKKEYIKRVAERRKRNKQINDKLSDLQQKLPNFTKNAWRQLNADQQMQLLENNGIVVEFVQ